MLPDRHGLTGVAAEAAQGTLAGPDQLVQAFYPELRRLAEVRMRREAPDHTWQPTVLVNELFLELTKVRALRSVDSLNPREKASFLALASQIMSRLLVRHTRPLAWKAEQVEVPESLGDHAPGAEQLAWIESLLGRLEKINPQLRTVVELRVFGGAENEEIAEFLGCTSRTVSRHWQFARAWLEKQLFQTAL